jgi:hypothetical protein
MDQATGYVKSPTEQPHNKKNRKNSPKHEGPLGRAEKLSLWEFRVAESKWSCPVENHSFIGKSSTLPSRDLI